MAEKRRVKEEQLSTQRCLEICAQLSDHIGKIQLTSKVGDSSPSLTDPTTFPEHVTVTGLNECKTSLALATTQLEKHMQDLMHRLITKSKTAMTSGDEVAELARLQAEWDTTRKSMDICSRAETHLRESISTIDNYATGDAVQFMVSTNGKVIHGKNRGLGWRTRQVGGYVSDASVQQLSRDMTSVKIQNVERDEPLPQANSPSGSESGKENVQPSDSWQRHGQGFKLASEQVGQKPSAGLAKKG